MCVRGRGWGQRRNVVGPVCEFILSGDSNFHHMGIIHHFFFVWSHNLPKIFLKNGHVDYICLLIEKMVKPFELVKRTIF